MTTLRLSEANNAIVAALGRAKALGIGISVSVCDSQGHLIAHQRMDGIYAEASGASIGKAVAAAEWGRPSGDSFEGLTDRPPRPAPSQVPNIRRRGGLPVIRNGSVEGAIGVGGGQNDEELEECAKAGVAALHRASTN